MKFNLKEKISIALAVLLTGAMLTVGVLSVLEWSNKQKTYIIIFGWTFAAFTAWAVKSHLATPKKPIQK
jgi:hypothetical protein